MEVTALALLERLEKDGPMRATAALKGDPRWLAWYEILTGWVGGEPGAGGSWHQVSELLKQGMPPGEIWAVYVLIWE